MFEAKILQGSVLKKIIEAIRELVADANLDCNERGITMQVCYLLFIGLHFLIFLFYFYFSVVVSYRVGCCCFVGNGLLACFFMCCCLKIRWI
jgi:hypothetical protein